MGELQRKKVHYWSFLLHKHLSQTSRASGGMTRQGLVALHSQTIQSISWEQQRSSQVCLLTPKPPRLPEVVSDLMGRCFLPPRRGVSDLSPTLSPPWCVPCVFPGFLSFPGTVMFVLMLVMMFVLLRAPQTPFFCCCNPCPKPSLGPFHPSFQITISPFQSVLIILRNPLWSSFPEHLQPLLTLHHLSV